MRIRNLIQAALDAGLGSGAAVSVGDGGREVERFALGVEQKVPVVGPEVTDDTLFDLASLTKPMATATVAMHMVGSDQLALGTPIRHFLASAASTGTVADLLSHRGGCAAHIDLFRDVATFADPMAARRLLLQHAATAPLVCAPGTTAVYSDLGYLQLGEILERVASQRLDALVASRVAEPLGLTSLCFFDRAEDRAHERAHRLVVATEDDPQRGGVVRGLVHDENSYAAGGVTGHAGLFGSIKDVAGFAAAMVRLGQGANVGGIRAEVAAQFWAPVTADSSWRLGWDTPSQTPGVSHVGDRWPRQGCLGHLGFTGTSLWFDFRHGRWVALLTNRVHPRREGTADAIKSLRRAVGDAAWDMLEGLSDQLGASPGRSERC